MHQISNGNIVFRDIGAMRNGPAISKRDALIGQRYFLGNRKQAGSRVGGGKPGRQQRGYR